VAAPLLLQPIDDGLLGLVARGATERARMDHRAVLGVEQHVAVERQLIHHLHHRAVFAHRRIHGLAARQDRPVGFDRIKRDDAIFKLEQPAGADDLVPVARFQRALHQRGVSVHLRVFQRDVQRLAGITDGSAVVFDPGRVQFAFETFIDRTGEDQALADAVRIGDDGDNRQAKFQREGTITLIVRRHGHDGARAVGHQHVIRDPDGDAFVIDWINGIPAGEHAGFFLVSRFTLHIGLARSV